MGTTDRTDTFEIGPALSADASAVASIWHRGWQDGHHGFVPDDVLSERTEPDFQRRVQARLDEVTVARTTSGPAGFVIVVEDELEQIYVDRSYRGSTVATVLLGEAERQIVAAGHEQGWLAVVAGNARARAFYQRLGWSDAGPISYEAEGRSGTIAIPAHRYEKNL